MSIQSEIDTLQSQLAALKHTQESCRHQFLDPYQAVEVEKEFIYENRPMGSDFFNPVVVGSKDVEKLVWKRECKLCGLVQTTTKTEPVVSHHKPVF